MRYYQQNQDNSIHRLLEVLREEAKKNPHWTLQGLLALCKEVSLLDEDPAHADYFDSVYLVLAELFTAFRKEGKLTAEGLEGVRSFSMDAASQQELLSALTALQSGVIGGRIRVLANQWQQEGSWWDWQQYLGNLMGEILSATPNQPPCGPDVIEAAQAGEVVKQEKAKRDKRVTAVLWAFSVLGTWFALYILLQGLGATCQALSFRFGGSKTSAVVVQIAEELREPGSSKAGDPAESLYFEVVEFTAGQGQTIQARLPGKSDPDTLREVGDKVEIYYLPDAPARIAEARSITPLVNGLLTVAFGLLSFTVLAKLGGNLIAELGRMNRAVTAGTVVVLLLLAGGVQIHQNILLLYRYLPAADESACVNSEGVLLSQKSGKPYSGLVRSRSENVVAVYSYRDGQLDGLDVVYYDGAVKETGHWKEGQQNGLFTLYTTTGVLVDYATFANGERHGLTRQFDPESGALLCEGNYKNGFLDGVWKAYYPSGGIASEQTYREGVLDGPARQYYESGQLQIDMMYAEGAANGPYTLYYPNGQINAEGTLENGNYTEDWRVYTEDGSLVKSSGSQGRNPVVDP